MTQRERAEFQQEFSDVQKEITRTQAAIRKNPALLKDPKFDEERTKLFYKSYCIDCTLHGVFAASYNQYVRGE